MAPGRVVTRVARIVAPSNVASAPGEPPTSPSGLLALAVPSALDDAAGPFRGASGGALRLPLPGNRLRLDEYWLRPRRRRRGGHAPRPLAAMGRPGHWYVAGSGRCVAGPPGAT